MEDETVEQEFDRFKSWCRRKSDLYRLYCERIVEDRELRDFIDTVEAANRPYVLFAAVHYLLLGKEDEPLARYYPSIAGEAKEPAEGSPGRLFRDFCLENRERIRELVENRKTQTNEVRRCSALLPGFAEINDRVDEPVSMVEVGASAGLNLFWKSYGYRYPGYREIKGEEPVIECEIREGEPPLDVDFDVEERIGLDINPLDVSDEKDRRWLKALTWPEHEERRERLEKALQKASDDPPEVREGDAVDDLVETVSELDEPVIIYGTQVLWALDPDRIEEFLETIGELQQSREIYCLFGERGGIEWLMGDRDSEEEVWLEFFREPDDLRKLGEYGVHGSWLRWRN